MLDALGSRLRTEDCCSWLGAVKPLLQAAWGVDDTARWLTKVEERSEHEAAEDEYRYKKHERALIVERYRTMMRQLRHTDPSHSQRIPQLLRRWKTDQLRT